ncbi:MAG: hypothetical protein NC548_13075 [Lachnospiraceae bacterium]|nr:hypothetical protein [Lachnospiraceae bacterium]MCM1230678.1 hypothetical protein [Ruminococcus flavefaciens]
MMNDIKQQIINDIEKRVTVFKPVPPIRYRIRCPYCGDSQKNPRDAHCYIKCSPDPTEPLQFKCFLCNRKGRVRKDFLDLLGVDSKLSEQIDNQRYKRIGIFKSSDIKLITGEPNLESPQVRYIEDRLGPGFELEDYEKFKIIWDIPNLMNEVWAFDNIKDKLNNQRILNTMPSNRNSISFLSDDKSMILNRSFDDKCRWRKIKIIPNDDTSFYTIKTTLDLFTKDEIVVNIAEGIFDVLSIYRNFTDSPNSVHIATLGSDYASALNYAISKGFIGTNVTIRIYYDSNIDGKNLLSQMKPYKWIFGGIYLYRNIIGKDVGVRPEKIKLVETRV